LQEAQYDPKNVIKITGRATRIPKQVEVYEAMDSYLDGVGINAEINVVEASVRDDLRQCAIGKAVSEVLEAKGLDPETAEPTLADMQAALDKGGSDCPTSDLIESPSPATVWTLAVTLLLISIASGPSPSSATPAPAACRRSWNRP
jgi:hypothetical protein